MKQITFTLFALGILLFTSCEKPEEQVCKPTNDCIDSTIIDSLHFCTAVYRPVCGCDGITYSNGCMAKNAGVKKFTSGPCNPIGCIDSSLVDPLGVCPMVIDPVCGCDGITYSNSCEANKAGVTKYKKGACK